MVPPIEEVLLLVVRLPHILGIENKRLAISGLTKSCVVILLFEQRPRIGRVIVTRSAVIGRAAS